MARATLNPAICSLSGRIDGYIFRHQPDGNTALVKVSSPALKRVLSPAQSAQVQRFKDATLRCRQLLEDPPARAAYQRLLAARSPMLRLNAMVISDILHPPIPPVLDLSAYHGSTGDLIYVLAEDNLAIARLELTIRDLTTGQVMETGDNVPPIEQLAPRLEWYYTAASTVPAGHTITVRVMACDLAGNRTSLSSDKSPVGT